MNKIICALATLAFIGSINVVSADDLMRLRLNGNSIYDQPYGDRNEFPCPDGLGSCSMTDEDYRSVRKGQALEVFDTAVHELKRRNLTVIVHVILFLPGETHEMMLETIEYLNHSNIDGIKLQLLHILKGTDLAVEYQKFLSDPAYTGPAFHIPDADEYIRLLTECIQHLRPGIVIHRLTGDGPKDLLIAPLWSGAKRTVLN